MLDNFAKMKCAVGTILFLLLIAAANAQPGTRNCSQEDQTQVFITLGLDGATCGLQLATANNPDSYRNTSAGVEVLEAACVQDCVGELTQGILCQCNLKEADSLRGFCSRSDGRIAFCREAYEDIINPNITAALAPCLVTFQDECPAGCANPLQAFADEIGCCYQELYNATVDLGLVDVSPEQRVFFTPLANPLLWNSCNVTIPDDCPQPAGLAVLNPADCAATQATTMGAAVVLATKTVAVLLTLLAYYAV